MLAWVQGTNLKKSPGRFSTHKSGFIQGLENLEFNFVISKALKVLEFVILESTVLEQCLDCSDFRYYYTLSLLIICNKCMNQDHILFLPTSSVRL